ncbi:hypothetical protein VTN96DRAFT_1184 [Rasamsonia emersonii]|uniref:NAD-dependent protein deacetylase n=1 Tax=Rasamsonia emersonii (strain ATCC 16479 / CBS 393.64 / IMI 116815) TaxID=1408163 RepID=A0A0F4YQQ8_RASE3|nr:SIR2 family histone deacetylase [Rasamsonia emersonii CBS 393.64]KKA20156.1 SIR2 family histone deacetylase [Rasamsonia emersonii CBS 393.64]
MSESSLKSPTVDDVARLINAGKATQIVVLVGAGTSASAGIPDFRSPDTGLYAQLEKFHLPYPEAPLHISYFRHTPEPFYAVTRALYPGKYRPTVAHAFIALLARKRLLHMLVTQNVDDLERRAGVPEDKILAAHGSLDSQRCIDCKSRFPDDLMQKIVQSGGVPRCQDPQCNGIVKPDVVLFGEPLPASFEARAPQAMAQADLVIIMGTSLVVHPVAGLPGLVREGVPRVLVNREKVGSIGGRPDDVCILGDCDDGVRQLADALGWREELEALWREVGGGRKDGEDDAAASSSSKVEINLEMEIANLSGKVDRSLKISNGHRNWLERHLEKKIAASAANADSSTEQRKEESKKSDEDRQGEEA